MTFETLDARMRRIAERERLKNAKKNAEKKAGEVLQLPLWPEPVRGTPNSLLRGALFAAIQGKERHYLKAELLACQKGICIRFTGMQLDQSDLDVWEQAVQLARSHPLGNVCHFSINGFLRELGRNTGKSDHEWLKDSFRRLTATCVEISNGRYTYGGSMLEFKRDEIEGVYTLRLNPTILDLYEAGWTAIDWEVRQQLRRKPLALWLHGWLASNAENYPTKIDTIRQLSGSRNPHKGSFKRQLQAALTALEVAGSITSYRIKGDLVSVQRTPSPTQVRHIIQKTKPGKPRA